MANNQIVLTVERLWKAYKGIGYEVQALKNVSFDLQKGELLAVMGTSGSGKSTLLNILGTLDEPDKGKIWLNGKHDRNMFTEPYAAQFRRDNIGFIFQSFNLLKDLTVEENIALPLILKGVEKETLEQKVDGMLELVGLSNWRRHRPFQLSGGQQQRVAIGRALITAPPIILADELTGNLDFNTSTEILHVLIDMKKTFEQSIIMVTHDPKVATYADRVIFFHDGQIVDEYKCASDHDDMANILHTFQEIIEMSNDKVY